MAEAGIREEVVSAQQSTAESQTALSGITAIARFEFEQGKMNDGTKILMVEWQDEKSGRSEGSWEVTWSGKTDVLGAENKTNDTKRLYFLLPPNTTVPPQVTLSWKAAASAPPLSMNIHTLPAIFPSELGASAKAKGVLHTLWAKSRLRVLEREIEQERAMNLEGVALEMALSERGWILSTFGLAPKAPALDLSSLSEQTQNGQLSPSLQTPRTPGGGRLSEMLKGLSIATSEKDLTRGANTPTKESHGLPPEGSDMAVSSLGSFRSGPTSTKLKTDGKIIVATNPPEHIKKQQTENASTPFGFMPNHARAEVEDDSLFAIALSPRTPDLAKSPFSFQSEDITPYAKMKDGRPS